MWPRPEDECARQNPAFQSPVGITSNRLLWGDNDKGEVGVLVRSIDMFDYGPSGYEAALKNIDLTPETFTLNYLPASHLHGSMRASGAIFEETKENSAAILVGTKYKKNWAMKEYQRSENTVDCVTYFPSDAGSLSRGVLESPTLCRRDHSAPLCVEEDCLADNDSACGGCKVPPREMGDLVARWYEQENTRTAGPFTYSMCDYADIEDMVIASNSLWKERHRWFDMSPEYSGYSECPATISILDHESVADALVIPLYVGDPNLALTLCDYPDMSMIGRRLEKVWNLSRGNLPVLFYRETQGLRKIEECQKLWGGEDCNDGFHKEFFSQEYLFDDHSCIHRPSGCQEVYYFPPDGNQCSAFTNAGKSRIEELCAKEGRMDAVLASTSTTQNQDLQQGHSAISKQQNLRYNRSSGSLQTTLTKTDTPKDPLLSAVVAGAVESYTMYIWLLVALLLILRRKGRFTIHSSKTAI